MKTSLQWLGDFLPSDAYHRPIDSVAAAEALTHGGLPVENFETHGDDSIIDVEVTSNRADCLCHAGVARELSALLSRPFRGLDIHCDESEPPTADAVKVFIDAPDLCPHYTARLIRGVKVGPSPAWMSRRLEAVGIRPINNIVDVTNYVMLEMGQPLHAFDFSRISGGMIRVRNAAAGETLTSIDGRKRDLLPSMLVIADAQRPVALAGVMGGLDSEVTAATTDVLLESARFDPLSIRRTARALAMKSDSSYRFERGIDPTLSPRAAIRAVQLILETAGGRLCRGAVQAGQIDIPPKTLFLRLARLRQVLGVDLPVDGIMNAFGRLSLNPVLNGDSIAVTVPSHRLDINQEIDLVEEAARVLGYDRIPTRREISIQLTPPQSEATTVETICQTLVSSGYFEAITFSFVSDALRTDFGASGLRADASVRKADASLRPSLVPGLLQAVRWNESNGTMNAKLFEIGSVFRADEKGVDETRKLAWVGGADLRHIRGVVEAVLGRLDADRPVSVTPDAQPGFAKGACARVLWGGQPIGILGSIDKAVIDKLSLRESLAAAELDLAPLLQGHRHVPQLRELPRFPAVRRDLSLIVRENVTYEKIDCLVRGLALEFLESIEFVTAYRGKSLEKGKKSITITLVFRSSTETLISDQVEAAVLKVIEAAKQQLDAEIKLA